MIISQIKAKIINKNEKQKKYNTFKIKVNISSIANKNVLKTSSLTSRQNLNKNKN